MVKLYAVYDKESHDLPPKDIVLVEAESSADAVRVYIDRVGLNGTITRAPKQVESARFKVVERSKKNNAVFKYYFTPRRDK
ncbi:MAG: hypothetical protein EOM31_13290 [Bacteroidia bacterium]|nr:hypothetical protein [Bacteroidia bacterium]